jgi:ABC-2 type transport system ATP-binding protein
VRTLGTLIAPTTGSATVAGYPLTPENGVEIRRRIAVMPESPGLYLRLSVAENLECFADLCEVPGPAGRIDRWPSPWPPRHCCWCSAGWAGGSRRRCSTGNG